MFWNNWLGIYIRGGDENLTITESCDRHSSEQFHLSAGYIDFIVIKTQIKI